MTHDVLHLASRELNLPADCTGPVTVRDGVEAESTEVAAAGLHHCTVSLPADAAAGLHHCTVSLPAEAVADVGSHTLLTEYSETWGGI